jgi:hypothetical protein
MAMEHNGQLTVQEAGPDHLLLIEEAGPSFSAFGDGGANGGQLAFQTRGVALLVAPGYQLVENSLTAIVEVTLTGSSKVVLNGQAQLGEAGKSKTVSLELSLPMNNVSMDADTNLDGVVAGGLMGPFLMQKGTGPQFLLDYAASPGGSVVGQVTKVIYRATVAAVPEPSTWAMMALGLVGLAGVRRQRR